LFIPINGDYYPLSSKDGSIGYFSGYAYEFKDVDKGEGIPFGILKANTAIVFNTSNTPPDREQQRKEWLSIVKQVINDYFPPLLNK